MNITFDQIVYGHDGTGYRILADTDTNSGLAWYVQSLCEELGTPDPTQEIPEFLVSVPMYGKLIMMRGIQGPNDHSNRTTLFFHVLICSQNDAQKCGVDAFYLLRKQRFISELLGTLQPFSLEKPTVATNSVVTDASELKQVVIVSSKAQNDRIQELLGPEVNQKKWATFSWYPLSDFDFYVLGSREKQLPCAIIKEVPASISEAEQQSTQDSMTKSDSSKSKSQEEGKQDSNWFSKIELYALYFMLVISFATNLLFLLKIGSMKENESQLKPEPQQGQQSAPLTPEKKVFQKEIQTIDDLIMFVKSCQIDGSWPDGIPQNVSDEVTKYFNKIENKDGTFDSRIKEFKTDWNKICDYFRDESSCVNQSINKMISELNERKKELFNSFQPQNNQSAEELLKLRDACQNTKLLEQDDINICISEIDARFRSLVQKEAISKMQAWAKLPNLPEDWRNVIDDQICETIKASNSMSELRDNVELVKDSHNLPKAFELAKRLQNWEITVTLYVPLQESGSDYGRAKSVNSQAGRMQNNLSFQYEKKLTIKPLTSEEGTLLMEWKNKCYTFEVTVDVGKVPLKIAVVVPGVLDSTYTMDGKLGYFQLSEPTSNRPQTLNIQYRIEGEFFSEIVNE